MFGLVIAFVLYGTRIAFWGGNPHQELLEGLTFLIYWYLGWFIFLSLFKEKYLLAKKIAIFGAIQASKLGIKQEKIFKIKFFLVMLGCVLILFLGESPFIFYTGGFLTLSGALLGENDRDYYYNNY